MKKIRNKSIIFIIPLIATILFVIIPIILNLLILPKQINLTVGTTQKLDFNIPAVATIISDEENLLSVQTSSNISTISEENSFDTYTNINLKNPIYISSKQEGNHNIQISMLGIPVSNIQVSVISDMKLIASGEPVGIRINTAGVMVLGFSEVRGQDGNSYEPAKGTLKAGDMILEIDDYPIDSKETLIDVIESAELGQVLNICYKRNNEVKYTDVAPVISENGTNKIGAWVRDSTQGIGTLTFINPDDNSFGALGHGIVDVDTKEIMEVRDGKIMEAEVYDIQKGEKGNPGELIGNIRNYSSVGEIVLNSDIGIYGTILNSELLENKTLYPVGLKQEVVEGEASILCTIDDGGVQEYSINIEGINKYNLESSKSIILKITDERLLNATNGIIQGMSGSPILQNEKIIGAITHVFVNDPSKGYGIFIENMLQAME